MQYTIILYYPILSKVGYLSALTIGAVEYAANVVANGAIVAVEFVQSIQVNLKAIEEGGRCSKKIRCLHVHFR